MRRRSELVKSTKEEEKRKLLSRIKEQQENPKEFEVKKVTYSSEEEALERLAPAVLDEMKKLKCKLMR